MIIIKKIAKDAEVRTTLNGKQLVNRLPQEQPNYVQYNDRLY